MVNPNPVVAGENVILFGEAFDPDGNSITYTWTSESLFFANGQNLYESSDRFSPKATIIRAVKIGSQIICSIIKKN